MRRMLVTCGEESHTYCFRRKQGKPDKKTMSLLDKKASTGHCWPTLERKLAKKGPKNTERT